MITTNSRTGLSSAPSQRNGLDASRSEPAGADAGAHGHFTTVNLLAAAFPALRYCPCHPVDLRASFATALAQQAAPRLAQRERIHWYDIGSGDMFQAALAWCSRACARWR